MSARVIKHFWTTSQKAEAAVTPNVSQQAEPLVEAFPSAVDVSVKTVGALSPDDAPAAPYSKPSPSQEAGSLRRLTPELAPKSITPEPLQSGLTSSEPKVSIWSSVDASWPGSAWLSSIWPSWSSVLLLPVYLPPATKLLFLSFCPACRLIKVLPRKGKDVCARVCVWVCVWVCAGKQQWAWSWWLSWCASCWRAVEILKLSLLLIFAWLQHVCLLFLLTLKPNMKSLFPCKSSHLLSSHFIKMFQFV